MPTAVESNAALRLVTSAAVETAVKLYRGVHGDPVGRRLALLDAVPEIVGYYTAGSSALAADFYDDERALANARGRFTAEPIVTDRTEKIRRAVAWAAEPLFVPSDSDPEKRLAEVVQLEVARPYRDTITVNRQRDSEAIGWRRVSSGGCAFCRMLADRDVVYGKNTARFAAHEHCNCSAAPVFRGGVHGPEASVMQYVASQRRRSPAQQALLRQYLRDHYGDESHTH
ncbi:MAG TPA: hypothetical protein VFU07_07155 [Candidatus Lumbricidophila sp.]|nr:hypothetical protein [Candidatus Lumbricidophila sp.]